MKNILSLWSSRNLTLMGKITIVKSLIILLMIYKASMLPLIIPKTFITKINELIFKFIWFLIGKESAGMYYATTLNLAEPK